jgi:putative DNA primase/helicase
MSQIQTINNELPSLLAPKLRNILARLQAMQWAVSDPTQSDGGAPKAPRNARGQLLSPASGDGWLSFLVAGAALESGVFQSFGVRLDGMGIIGIDLDHYAEKSAEFPKLGQIIGAALERGAYVEKSPSGTGLRAFVFGKLPTSGVRKSKYGVELYADNRYLRVTGWKHRQSSEITADQMLIDDLLTLIGVSDAPERQALSDQAVPADDGLVEKVAAKVRERDPALWSGDLAIACDSAGVKYGPSEADMALCSVIKNAGIDAGAPISVMPDLIGRVMAQSGLARALHGDGTEKWLERADYRERTIAAVCAGLEAAPAVLKREAGVNPNAAGDIALAERFAQAQRGRLLWIPELAQWLTWTGTVWSACALGEEVQAAKEVLFSLVDEARVVMANDQERGTAMMRAAMSAQKDARIRAMLSLAKAEPGMSRSVVELNADPYMLGVQNGAVDLRTGALLEAKPGQLISRQCAAVFRVDAQPPTWLKFLDDVFMGDSELIAYVRRAVGYSLTGSNTEEVLFVCHGHGSNGKSLFHNVISRIMADYAKGAPADVLVQKPGMNPGAASPALAMLAGCRMLGINETGTGDRLDEQALKTLAGREAITARPLYGSYFTFSPAFTPWLRTNHKPVITGTDHAVWRRLALIPFKRQFSGAERDNGLEAKLWAERDGILAWMVAGAVEWSRNGLQASATVLREVQAYRQESDLLSQFLDEMTVAAPAEKVEQSTLYTSWTLWCGANGIKPTAKASFTRRLGELGHVEAKSNGRRFYGGLRMNTAGLIPPPV